MKNIVQKLEHEQYEKNFSELHPAFTSNQAIVEANRCLYCFDAPCIKACPTHIDIPTFIKKISTGNLKGSVKTILESNWIALSCAKACPVSVLCESICVHHKQSEKPIEIGRLQRYSLDWYFNHGMSSLFKPTVMGGTSIGIIGGGPAGLSCAAELALNGYDVTIYEGKKIAGGLATSGIAPYKMSYEDSLNEVKLIESLGVKIKTGVWVGENISIEELEKKHKAIFMGVGIGNSPNLNIPGENLIGVYDALEFIQKVTTRKWESVDVGKRVAVIGGGNTAIDVATEAKRLGAEEVVIVYRRSLEEMPAYKFEYDLAKKDGIEFYFLTAPKQIIGKNYVEGMDCIRMKLSTPDEKGRRIPQEIPNSEFQIPVDMIIKSIGQNPNENFLSKIPNLKTQNGKILVNQETMQTSNIKYFAGGDCINGGKEIVNAAADGKKAAHGIINFLIKKD